MDDHPNLIPLKPTPPKPSPPDLTGQNRARPLREASSATGESDKGQSRRRRKSLSVAGPLFGWALLYSVFVIYGSLFPFAWQWPADMGVRWAGFWRVEFGGLDALANILLFLPYGLLPSLMSLPVRRQRWLQLITLATTVAVATQLAQLVVASRDPRLFDVFWNASGFIVGALMGPAILANLTRGWRQLMDGLDASYQRLPARLTAALPVAIPAITLLFTLAPFRFTDTANAINFWPFAGLLADDALRNLGELLVQIGLICLLLLLTRLQGTSWSQANGRTLLLIAGTEIAECFVAGAHPDITPLLVTPVIALLMHDLDALARQAPLAPQAASTDSTLAWRPLLVLLLVGSFGVELLTRLPGVPYNISELLNPFPGASVLLALALLLVGVGCGRLGQLQRGAGLLWRCLLLQLLIFALLRAAVTPESLHDVLGTALLQQTWRWPGLAGELLALAEFALRFAALTLPVFVALLAAVMGYSRGARALSTMVPLALLLPFAYWLQRSAPGTDNLIELVASDGLLGFGGAPALYLLVLLFALLAARVRFRLQTTAQVAITTLMVIGGAGLSWWLLDTALVSSLQLDGNRFSALQFLLGANREASLSTATLFLRWIVVYVIVLTGLALSLWLVRATKPEPKPATPRFAGFAPGSTKFSG